MSSDRRRPMWRSIALSTFGWFATIYIVSSASILTLTIHRHTRQYKESLERLSKDSRDEYMTHSGDVKTMKELFRDTAEEHGHGNVFLVVTGPDGSAVMEEAANPDIAKAMRVFAVSPRRTCRIVGKEVRKGSDSIAVRVRKTPLPGGRILLIGTTVRQASTRATPGRCGRRCVPSTASSRPATRMCSSRSIFLAETVAAWWW